MDMIELMPYYKEKRNSIYPLAKKYREDPAYVRDMIEKSIKSVDKAYDNIIMLVSTQEGKKEYEAMLQEDVEYWQGLEEAFAAEAAVSDDLSIDFMMDDYDRIYVRVINKRIREIIIAARKCYFVNMNKQSAKKIIDGMAAGDCSIITKNEDVYSTSEFVKSWEKYHPGEKLLSD